MFRPLRSDWLQAGAVAIALFVLYAATAPRSVGLEDDALFVLSSYYLGIEHPPGYPLFTLVGHLFTSLPFGSVAYRVHLASAFFGALTGAAAWLCARSLALGPLPAYVAAFALGVSPVFWSQSIIAEVYTLNTLFLLVLVFLGLRAEQQPGILPWMAFVFGLSLANHYPLMLLAAPAFAVLLWPLREALLRRIGLLLILVIAGLAPYAWLIYRSWKALPISFYGELETLTEIWYFLSRSGYADIDHSVTAGLLDKLRYLTFVGSQLFVQFALVGTVLGAVGFAVQWRLLGRRIGAFLTLSFLMPSVGLVLLLGFDYDVFRKHIFHVYPLPAYAIVALWIGLGFAWLVQRHALGRPQALAAAALGHFAGAMIGTIGLVLLAPAMAALAVDIGAPDYFAIMVLAFIAVTSVLGSSRVRGFASLLIGLTIGLIGLDEITGQSRLTFGSLELADGIDVVVVAVGLFAVGESLWIASRLRQFPGEPIPVGRPWLGREDLRRTWKPWLRGPVIGFPFGALPAGGAEIPTFLSYATEKRLSKNRKEFGSGAIEGVAGPEATASASAAGTLVSMLTLGLPTTATAAVMLAAFQQYGIQPGPLLFERESTLVWGLIASLFVGLFLLLLLNLPLAPVWAKMLRIPRPYLYAGILFFASVGAYAVSGQVTDLLVLYVIGLLGFAMRRYGLPVLPAIIGVILGPAAETQMRRALQLSDGSLSGLVNTTFSVTVYLVVALILLWPLLRRFVGKASRRSGTPVGRADAGRSLEHAQDQASVGGAGSVGRDHSVDHQRERGGGPHAG